MSSSPKKYITTPLYYVNDAPHIGSAYPTIVCDFLSGHYIQRGFDVQFLTGCDEHGQKIEKAATANAKSPLEHCDYISDLFKDLWTKLDISYSKFVRTSSTNHKDFVTSFFTKVQDKDDIYKGEYVGLYCVDCEDFKLEKDLINHDGQENCCPIHRRPVEEYKQENYFFALTKYEDKLKKYIEDNPEFISPEYRKNEVLGWLEEGLRDFPISRVNLNWGVDIPNDSQQKIYVWFDALLGYISGLANDKEEFWSDSSEILHIIGKDILRFHAVYWPAMLMSAGFPLPKKVFGHGFLTKDGMKMGKALGNVIDPIELVDEFGSDATRFYFLRDFPFGRDGDYTRNNHILRLNTDLANNFGNLLSRCTNLYYKNYRDDLGMVPELIDGLLDNLINLEKSFIEHIDNINTFQAFEDIFIFLNSINAKLNEIEPWKLFKSDDKSEHQLAKQCIFSALEVCRRVAILIAPVTPKLSLKVLNLLGCIDDSFIEQYNIASSNNLDSYELLKQDFLSKYASFAKLSDSLTNSNLELMVRTKPQPVFMRIEERQEA